MSSVFSQLPRTRKGTIAEQYVRDVLINRGWHIYTYSTAGRPHPVDMLAFTPDNQLVAVEVKCKPARLYYPDTGIDVRHYHHYHNLQAQLNLPILLLFVDEYSKTVYGNYLNNLSQPITIVHNKRELVYPMIAENLVYFPLQVMNHYADIPPAIVAQIKSYRVSKYNYPLPPTNDCEDNRV
jgi:hypothetical protein